MVLDFSDDDCLVNEENDTHEDVVDDDIDESRPNKKRRGKVPKRALKAEREKLKREHLNELFAKLGSLLELSDQNNGKASILNETIRLLKDMISQIQSLRKENVTLSSESHYVATETNELKDENCALEVQIKSMQTELEEKLANCTPHVNANPPECWQAETQAPPILGPLYVIPINPEFQAFHKDGNIATHPPVPVSKPHPRYPTPADSWPLHLLSKQP